MGFGTNGDDVAMSRFRIAQKAVAPATVSAPNGGFSDQAFLSALASGSPPDLAYMSWYQIGTYAAKGALEPLTSCISGQHINMSKFTSAARGAVTYNGTVYGIPEFSGDTTVIVNDAAVTKAGLTPSAISTTSWSKLLTTAKKLTVFKGGKLQTIGFDPKKSLFPLWVAANGGSILSSNGLTAHLNSPKAVQALTYFLSLVKAEGGYNQFTSYKNSFNFFGANNPVAANQLAAWPMQDWYYNVLASTSPTVKVTAVPFTSRTGKVLDYTSGAAWVIPKGSKNPAAACQWAKTMTATSTWLAAARNRIALYKKEHYYFTGLQTANKVADAAIIKLYDATSSPSTNPFNQAVQETYKVESGAFTVPTSPAGEEVNTALTNAILAALQGQKTPQQALDAAQSQAQAAINAAK